PLIVSFVMLLVAVILSYIIYTKYKLAKIAYTDDLTGQDNYAKFLKEAAITIEHSSSNFAVVALDINNFKILNDTLGRDEGDSILQQVAAGLKKNLRRNELVARNTADNFVMLTEFSSNDEIISRLKNFCDEFLLTSIHTGRVIKTPTFSIGIYPVPPGVNDVCQMTSNADLARKSSKATHTNVFAFYDKDLHQQILQEKKLELTLVSALQNREFEVYLQPKFSLNTRKIIGAEALVRWNHPQKGLLPPGKFISICERTGLIVDLDFFVYERTFEIIASWLKRGIKPVPVSVNVSRVHLQNPHFVEAFIETANHYDIPHELIECELTENLFFDDMAQLNTVVDEFKQSNFFVSIDDFGSGYSSLNMLKDVPVDILKLDREFFSRDEGVREKVVIQNIIRMAKELDMKVICEGVETEKQASFLQSVDCNMAQGYLFARPVPLSEFEKLLIKSNEENKE
ncbi:MAG: bifunctional diguanylate cyclase/phosphodiesterase, partial [Oscillospiraceae bacterium]